MGGHHGVVVRTGTCEGWRWGRTLPVLFTWSIWVLLVLLTTCTLSVVAPQSPDVCPQLMYVAGNRDYPYVEGLYLLQDSIQDDNLSTDYPIYRHACHDNYLYYQPTHTSWWIGPELGMLSGYALSYSSEADPSRLSGPWRYWSHSLGEWFYDEGARLVCLNISCQRLAMVSHQLPAFVSGEFHLTDVIHYDRPVYENTATGSFLYHNRQSRSCNAWLVGSRIGAENPFMHVYDAARDPLEVSANWTLNGEQMSTEKHITTEDIDILNVTLVCLELYKYYNTDWRTSKVSHTTEATKDSSMPTTKEDSILSQTTSQTISTQSSGNVVSTAAPVSLIPSVGWDSAGHTSPTEGDTETSLPAVDTTTILPSTASPSAILTHVPSTTERVPPSQPGFRVVTPSPVPTEPTSPVPTQPTSPFPSQHTSPIPTQPTSSIPDPTSPSDHIGGTSPSVSQGVSTGAPSPGEVTSQGFIGVTPGGGTNRTSEGEEGTTPSVTVGGVNTSSPLNETLSSPLPLGPTSTAAGQLPAACGEVTVKAAISFLISGTASAYQGKWPWMVVILNSDNTTKCGAALISTHYLVTAAHCIDGSAEQLAAYKLVLGANNRDISEPGIQTRSIRQVLLHTNFSHSGIPFRITSDLGLIEMDEPVVFSQYLQPVCLPDNANFSLPLPGVSSNLTSCFITGFGYYHVDSVGRMLSRGGILQEQSVRLQTIESCAKRYFASYRWLATSDNLCVRPNRNAKLCQGDSGSPLMCRQGSRWTLVGVASWSIAACVSGNFPSIYVDLRLHADWIRQTINSQSATTTVQP